MIPGKLAEGWGRGGTREARRSSTGGPQVPEVQFWLNAPETPERGVVHIPKPVLLARTELKGLSRRLRADPGAGA